MQKMEECEESDEFEQSMCSHNVQERYKSLKMVYIVQLLKVLL